jgi:hypothetical protein
MSVLPLYALAERVDPGQTTPVMVFPLGIWHTRKYGDLTFTAAIADRLIANFESRALEQTQPFVDSGGHDEQSAATGWVQRVYRAPYKDPKSGQEGEAVWADVTWNVAGAELINSRKFRYISPVLAKHIVTTTGEELEPVLRSLSPTNVPVLRAMPGLLDAPEWLPSNGEFAEVRCSEVTIEDPPDDLARPGTSAVPGSPLGTGTLAAATTANGRTVEPTKEKNMDDLAKVLQLAEDADEATILAEVTRITERNDELETQLTESTERITTLESDKTALETTIAEERQAAQDADRDRIIAALIDGGHVAPAEKDDLVALADSNYELFVKHAETRKAHRVIDLKDRGVHSSGEEPKQYADPSAEVMRRAKELQAKNDGLKFMEAVGQVLATDDDLASQYGALVTSGYDD